MKKKIIKKIKKEIEINKKYDPLKNYYMYVNSKWIYKNKIPKGYSRWGTFDMMRFKMNKRISKIIDEIEKKKKINRDEKKILDFYKSYKNKKLRNKLGINPIKDIINYIRDEKNNLYEIIELMLKNEIPTLFKVGAETDIKDSKYYITYIGESELNLPNKDYYKKKRFKKIREEYKKMIEKIVKKFKMNKEEKKEEEIVNKIYNFDKNIAEKKLNIVDSRDIDKIYNKRISSDFFSKRLDILIKKLNLGEKVIITNPKYMKEIDEMLERSKINKVLNNEIRLWLEYQTITNYLNYLDIESKKIYNDFYKKILLGVDKILDKKTEAVIFTNNMLGDLIGKKYIKKYFNKETKEEVKIMVKNVKEGLRKRITDLEWMSEKTKIRAINKLDNMLVKVGYPEKNGWNTYDIETNKNELINNIRNLDNYIFKKYVINRVGKLVNKDLWYMSPQTINAYYSPDTNEICLPAGILDGAFYKKGRSDYENYGGCGTVIGHEIIHGYDDSGMRYDEKGNLNNWWLEEDKNKYKKKTKELEKQYNKYKLNGININGKLTLGENIADLGGVILAYEGLKIKLGEKLDEKGIKDFFKSYANTEKQISTKEYILDRIYSDPHSPSEFRINGVMCNIPEFYKAYNIPIKKKIIKIF
jgi:putative endopeptidase